MEVFSFLLLYLFPPAGKGVADGFAKGRLLRCERRPFTLQKAAFCRAKGALSRCKRPSFAF